MRERRRHRRPNPPAAVPEPVGPEAIEAASWLANNVLILAANIDGQSDSDDVSMVLEGLPTEIESRCLSYRIPASTATPDVTRLLVGFLPDSGRPLDSTGLVIKTPQTSLSLSAAELDSVLTDLPTLISRTLAPQDARTRAGIIEFLGEASASSWLAARPRMSKSLFLVREALRERQPRCVVAQDESQGLAAEAILGIDDTAFYIKGWMRDEEAEIVRLTAVSPEGARAELRKKLFRYPRADVEEFYVGTPSDSDREFGFVCFFELFVPSLLSNGWVLEMENSEGTSVEVEVPTVISDTAAMREAILADLEQERLPNDALRLRHVMPAMSRLQDRIQTTVEVESVFEYGVANDSPEVSIIVPLYQRIDLLEQQLAQFVHDPQIRDTDLIYVLDSPELADDLRDAAAELFTIYRIPFRVAILESNVGYAGANNAGASLARGRLLLLLNSDVFPEQPGWVETMQTFYDSTSNIGALGAKLVYEDDSLQHAGLFFSRPAGSFVWENWHYFKGLHRTLPAANVARAVPAVTGACLMIARSLYEELGGLKGAYVKGDYEDSDLCLRLIEHGRENWYLPNVELYHLEAQSYSGLSRALASDYNRWLHTHLWGERIASSGGEPGVSAGQWS